MKKTWKCWLGTVAAAMLGSTVMAQPPQGPGFGSDLPFGDEGAVRLGDVSGSATTGGPATAQFDLVRPLDADAVWGEAPLAYQGAPPPGDESVGFASAASYADVQWRVGRVNNDMYGFNGGYTTLNAFIPLSSDDRNLWFMDPRLNITDYGEGAANFGIGYRRYSYAMDRIFGASAWYDYDPGHRSDYHQLGLSLENIGRYFSTRFNANVPLSDQNDFTTASSFGNPFFVGNNIGYIFSFLRETSYQNYTVEAAAPVPFFGRYGWEWAISGYGLVANGDSGQDAVGIGGRFEWQVAQDFWINTTITHDRIFGTNTSINFELTIPSGKQTRWLRPMRVHDKILASVKRPYRVSTSTAGQSENRLFLDPNDGAPIVVAHINPQAANGAAAGSVENPFGSVQDYMNLTAGQRSPFDIIFVGGNLLATNDTDLNTTIELLDRQRLLGTGALADGTQHQFQAIARNGVGFETLNLPNFANSAAATNVGPNPLLSNSGAAGTPVVRINGDYTEVSGFTIDAGGTADGIATVDAGLVARTVDSFVITNNTIQSAIQAMDIRSNTAPGATGPTTMPDVRSLTFDDNIGVISNNLIDGLAGSVPGVTQGIVVSHSGGADPLLLRVAANRANDVTDEAISVTATAGMIDASDTGFGFLGNIIDNSGVGIQALSTGAGTQFDIVAQQNEVTNSQDAVNLADPTVGAGMIFLSQAGGNMDIENFLLNTVTNNGVDGGRGAAFVADNATLNIVPAGPGDVPFANNIFSGNADDGAIFVGQNLGTITAGPIAENTFTNNGGDGLDMLADSGTAIIGPIVSNTISGNTLNGINGLSDNGLLNAQIGSNATGVPQSTITGNTLNGINLETINNGVLNGDIQNVAVTNNTQNGIRVNVPSGTANILIDGTPTADNLITGNGVDGVALVGSGTGVLNVLSMTNNQITGNTQDGIDLNLSGAATANLADVSGNTVTNGAFGMRVTTTGTSDFDLVMGASGAVNGLNVFNGNTDAGLGISMSGTSTGTFNITNSTFSNTLNSAADPLFNGDGIAVRLIQDASFTNATLGDAALQNTALTGNAGNGLSVFSDGTSDITNMLVQNTLIQNNTGDGINGLRQGSGSISNFQIIGNDIQNNSDGIDLQALGRDDDVLPADSYLIADNTIDNNNSVGIRMHVVGDADIFAEIDNNSISSNAAQGILTTEVSNTAGDTRRVDLLVTNNTIATNGDNGIELSASHNQFGDGPGVVIDTNDIINNTGDGIEVNAAGDELINNNTITGNTEAGIDINKIGFIGGSDVETISNNTISDNGTDGIEIQSISQGMTVNVNNNAIERNGQDGVEIIGDAGDTGSMVVNLDTNLIAANSDRGVAVFNRGRSTSEVNITNNIIERNLFEGVYVVNTASTTQSTDSLATAALAADGAVNADSRLQFTMDNNQVLDNGTQSAFSGTGLVIRVGTNDGGRNDITDTGGFANGIANDGVGARGGIVATITNNDFFGSRGADVFFQSFTSTVPPATTAGAWDDQDTNPRDPANDVFRVDSFSSDPLARLDLTFTGNSMLELSATNTGASYNNAEGVFKSRTQSQDTPTDGGADDNGPFISATRERNAQRQAARFNLPPGLVIGNSDDFLFSGVGQSTFRVNANANATNNFTFGANQFLFDTFPFVDQNSAGGVFSNTPNQLEFRPYGWGQLP